MLYVGDSWWFNKGESRGGIRHPCRDTSNHRGTWNREVSTYFASKYSLLPLSQHCRQVALRTPRQIICVDIKNANKHVCLHVNPSFWGNLKGMIWNNKMKKIHNGNMQICQEVTSFPIAKICTSYAEMIWNGRIGSQWRIANANIWSRGELQILLKQCWMIWDGDLQTIDLE